MKTPDTLKGTDPANSRVKVSISPELFLAVADLVHMNGATLSGTLDLLLTDALNRSIEAEESVRNDNCE